MRISDSELATLLDKYRTVGAGYLPCCACAAAAVRAGQVFAVTAPSGTEPTCVLVANDADAALELAGPYYDELGSPDSMRSAGWRSELVELTGR